MQHTKHEHEINPTKDWIHLGLTYLAAIIAVSIFVSIYGCNVSKHVLTTSTDSTNVVKVDSTVKTVVKTDKKEDNKVADSSGLSIDFVVDSATNRPTIKDTVHIQEDSNGGYEIEANIPIKSIKTNKSKNTEQKKDTSSVIVKSSTTEKSDSTHLVKEVKQKDIAKKMGLSDWITWLLIIGGAIVGIYCIAQSYLKVNPLAWLLGFAKRKTEEKV